MLWVGEGKPACRSWCREELGDVELGDARLNERLIVTAERMLSRPQASINQACTTWAETKAAYRFFGNGRVDWRHILEPHIEKTFERALQRPVVLAVQDSTTLDFSHHPATIELGPISNADKPFIRGLVVHSTLALTPQGLPLGLLDQQIWERDDKPRRKRARRQLPLEAKESFKWIKSMRSSAAQRLDEGTLFVCVGDREADIYELFAEAEARGVKYLIRARHDRSLGNTYRDDVHLLETLAQAPAAGELDIEVKGGGGRAPRQASVVVRFAKVSFRPPKRCLGSKLTDPQRLQAWAISVQEPHPPRGAKGIEWVLITNVETTTFAEACERVAWYTLRWHIEIFHRVLKSGLNVEESRLEVADRLERYVALASIIAVRLFQLTHLSRVHGEAPCTTVLSEAEWQVLYVTIKRSKSFPAKPPTLYQAVRWIAQMGGFLARKGDGEPGVTTLWRGYTSLMEKVDFYEALQAQ
jgi:hypothetical protein